MLMKTLDYSVTRAELVENVLQVITATANNYSSTHQDLKFKRQTEIEFINGYVTYKAAGLNVKVPHNQRLVEQIRQRQ
jgi:2-dehydropantoate 2-reductase